MKIGIITDSAAGIELSEMEENKDLAIIPLTIIDAQNNVYLDDNKNITSDLMYELMVNQKQFLKTSQTNSEIVKAYWRTALKIYDEIIFLPIGQDASGQYKNCQVLVQEEEFATRVTIVDTGAAMVPLKIIAFAALKLAQSGASKLEILAHIEKIKKNYECYIAISDLAYFLKGGRVPTIVANFTNFLKLKPILKCKEKITKVAIKRTLNSAITDMLKLITEKKENIYETLYIINAWCDENILQKAKDTALEFGFKNIKMANMCNILKAHTNKNTIGFAIVPNDFNL